MDSQCFGVLGTVGATLTLCNKRYESIKFLLYIFFFHFLASVSFSVHDYTVEFTWLWSEHNLIKWICLSRYVSRFTVDFDSLSADTGRCKSPRKPSSYIDRCGYLYRERNLPWMHTNSIVCLVQCACKLIKSDTTSRYILWEFGSYKVKQKKNRFLTIKNEDKIIISST